MDTNLKRLKDEFISRKWNEDQRDKTGDKDDQKKVKENNRKTQKEMKDIHTKLEKE
jgi:hypothetical protein